MYVMNGVLSQLGKISLSFLPPSLSVTFCPPPGHLGLCPLKTGAEADVGDDEDWSPLDLLLSRLIDWQRFLPPFPGPHRVLTVDWSAGPEVSSSWLWDPPDVPDQYETSDDWKHPHNFHHSLLTDNSGNELSVINSSWRRNELSLCKHNLFC